MAKPSEKKTLFWSILAGAGWGLALAYKNKKRNADYLTGALGGSLAGALAGMIINKVAQKPASSLSDEQKLLDSSKFSEINIQRLS